MFPGNEDKSLAVSNNQLWNKINNSENTQFIENETLYTSAKIKLLPECVNTENKRYFILLNTITFQEMNIDKKHYWKIQIVVLSVASVFFSILSLILSTVIFDRNKYREALKLSALYDQLTGLPNRKLLEERANQALINSRRYSETFAVFFIDLDGFKLVNDTFGHEAGDRLLKDVGRILKNSIRDTDTAARFGGDEFIILLSRINSADDCKLISEKILSGLQCAFIFNDREIFIGGSIGIAVHKPDSSSKFDEILQTADAAMYEIKKSGKNNYKIVSV